MPHSRLTDEQRERYARQLELEGWGPEALAALWDASVLVVGLGAAGSAAAAYLAAAGVGRLGLADGAPVAAEDMQRAVLHFTPDVGVAKVASAAAKIGFLNPEVVLDTYPVRVEEANAAAIVPGHDAVLDATNDRAAALALSDACRGAGVALVSVAVAGMEAVVQAVAAPHSPCLRCGETVWPPVAAGRVGAVAGAAGSLAALEVLKLLTGQGTGLAHGALRLHAGAPALEHVVRERDPECPICAASTL